MLRFLILDFWVPNLILFGKRGLCLIKMGKLDAALSDFSKACELEPAAAVYHYQKASLLHHRLARCTHTLCVVQLGLIVPLSTFAHSSTSMQTFECMMKRDIICHQFWLSLGASERAGFGGVWENNQTAFRMNG